MTMSQLSNHAPELLEAPAEGRPGDVADWYAPAPVRRPLPVIEASPASEAGYYVTWRSPHTATAYSSGLYSDFDAVVDFARWLRRQRGDLAATAVEIRASTLAAWDAGPAVEPDSWKWVG
jgi:hypothetical protein